jgi:hypothetical protein
METITKTKTSPQMTPEQEYEQFKSNLELLEFHQRKVEWLQKKTRQYIYAHEAQRVIDRKADSDRYYRDLENYLKQE